MKSVLEQTYANIEYIIVDGDSKDNTCNIIQKYTIDKRIKYLSEEDTGLYNAMNKSLNMITGDYVIFMNSGDFFVDENVLQNICNEMHEDELPDLIYGNVIRQTINGKRRECYGGRISVKRNLLLGRMISHQVMFFKTDVIKNYCYDETYIITADFNLLARMLKNKCSMEYIDIDVSVMENREGISANPTNLQRMREEDDRTIRGCFPFWYVVLRPIKYIKRSCDNFHCKKH
ncbi:MAG: glycosyltransferase [Lachnospiraceae bacterium]|nr:glycosyltransferase [Lachnospiraceae bacterium]